jgi:hypothetical protein
MKIRKPIFLFTTMLCLFSLLIVKSKVLAASTDTYTIYDVTGSGYSAPTIDGDPSDGLWTFMATHTIPGWSSPYDVSWYKMVHDFGAKGVDGYLYLLVFVKDTTSNNFVDEGSSHDWLVLQISGPDAGDSNMNDPSDAVFLQRGISGDPTYGCYEDGYFTGVGDSGTWVDGKSVPGFGSPGLGTQRLGYASATFSSTDGGWYFEAKISLDSDDTSGNDADFIQVGGLLTTAEWYFYWSYFDNEAGTGAGSHTGETKSSVGSIVTFSLNAVPEFSGLTFLTVLIIATVALSGIIVLMKKRKKLFQPPRRSL